MKAYDVQAWKAVALEIGLRVEDLPQTSDVEITSWEGADWGILWVSRMDIMKIEPGDAEIMTIDPGQALAVMGRLHRVSRKARLIS